MYTTVCTVCGRSYNARRAGAKYCSGACSCVAYRERKAILKRAEDAVLSLGEHDDWLAVMGFVGCERGLLEKLLTLVNHHNRPEYLRWLRYVAEASYANGKSEQLWLMVNADE